MKKVLFTIFNLFFLISCHQEDIDVPSPEPTGEKVTISMSLRVPESKSANSRAFNDNGSNINTLYLAVFNEYNFLEQVVEATMLGYDPTEVDGYQEGTSYKPGEDEVCFQVELKQSSNKRTIHFIAYEEGTEDELTAQIESMNYGAESTLIGSLSVSNGKDAYWQKVEFPYGIRDNDVTKNLMRRVPLVRNFAKIVVTENDNDFWIERIAVVSPAKVGSVAPNFDGGFAVFTNGEDPLGYDDIKTSGYEGYTPGNDIDINNLGTIVNWDNQNNQASTYLYERNQNSNTAYLLIEGRWGSESASLSYYKLDLVNTEGIRYNLLRNFQYNVTITNVVGSGYDSSEEAINNPAGNNISGATETENFLNISDGTRQLFVTYTKRTLVSGDVVKDLKFKYLPNINNATAYGTATVTAPAGDVLETAATVSSNHSDGWYTVTLDPKDPTAIPKIQEITISAGGLHRKIILTLREAYPLEVTCTPQVNQKMDSSVDVFINIDDNLPSYLFPLTFFIESSELSIYPDASQNNMPVNNRTTVVDEKSGNSFGFDRVLTWEEYDDLTSKDGKVSVPCYFLTNMDESACDIYVYNELFYKDDCSFENVTLQEFTNFALNNGNTIYRGAGTVVPLKFTTESATTITISTTGLTLKGGGTDITKVKEGEYTYTTSGATTVNLDNHFVLAANNTSEVSVTLNADNYLTTRLSAQTVKRKYTLTMNGAEFYGEDKSVSVSVSMDYAMNSAINATLTGLNGTAAITAGSTSATFYNITTATFTGERKVVIPGNEVYEEAFVSVTPTKLLIPANTISTNQTETRSVTISYNGKVLKNNVSFNSKNTTEISIEQTGLTENSTLTFTYRSGGFLGIGATTYTASATAGSLVNGTATLNFTEQ